MVYSAISDDTGTISQFTRIKYIYVTTNGSSTPVNYQVKLTIAYEPEMQADFSDIRFNTLGNMYIDYWIESKTDSVTATVWIELPDAITDPGSDTIWMCYGNAWLSDGRVGADTFPELFDNFTDGQYTSNPTWSVVSGTWQASNYYLEKTASADTWNIIGTPSTITDGIWEFDFKFSSTAESHRFTFMVMYIDSNNWYGYYINPGDAPNIRLIRKVSGAETVIISANWAADTSLHSGKVIRESDDTFHIYIDGIEYGIPVVDSSHSSSVKFQTWFRGVGERIDNILNRKYADNEPTPSYGTAQHQRRVPQFM